VPSALRFRLQNVCVLRGATLAGGVLGRIVGIDADVVVGQVAGNEMRMPGSAAHLDRDGVRPLAHGCVGCGLVEGFGAHAVFEDREAANVDLHLGGDRRARLRDRRRRGVVPSWGRRWTRLSCRGGVAIVLAMALRPRWSRRPRFRASRRGLRLRRRRRSGRRGIANALQRRFEGRHGLALGRDATLAAG
jgi:hypothetical protein